MLEILSSLLLGPLFFIGRAHPRSLRTYPITSALPDQGLQLRWQNSTDKAGRQRRTLWPAVFYRLLLIPDPIGLFTACSFNWRPSWPNTPRWHRITNRIRDQASNPIFNVVSPHTRAGFGLIPDPIGPVTACSSNWRPSWPNTPKWHRITNRIRDQFWLLIRWFRQHNILQPEVVPKQLL